MLNAKYKKDALTEAQDAAKAYKTSYDGALKWIAAVHNRKQAAVDLLHDADAYIHELSNTPPAIDTDIEQIRLHCREFQGEVETLTLRSMQTEKITGSIAGAGAVAGAGIAAFGPTAAMAIATTFGTASTGTAIATLSGAAATNAALAWLGGGAVMAGGAGVAGGEALLAMAGPVGWAIGAAALLSGGILMNSQNKKIAQKAIEQTKTIKSETDKMLRLEKLAREEAQMLRLLYDAVEQKLHALSKRTCRNYRWFTADMRDDLAVLINTSRTLSEQLRVKLNG